MLTFFRNIRKVFLSQGAASKYSLYALGEIMLVVIGILIALQIDNWNQDQKERQAEQKILEQIEISLSEDLDLFETSHEKLLNTLWRIERLQGLIESTERSDSLAILCGAAYGIFRFDFNTAAYEELKSTGFDLISHDRIRQLIIRVYEIHHNTIQHRNNIEDNVILEAMRPYYLSNFSKIRFLLSATPKNEDLIYEDEYFANLIDYRLTVLRNLHETAYNLIHDDMVELLDLIKKNNQVH